MGGKRDIDKVDWRRDCCLAKSNSTRVSSFEAPHSANSRNLSRSHTVFFFLVLMRDARLRLALCRSMEYRDMSQYCIRSGNG